MQFIKHLSPLVFLVAGLAAMAVLPSCDKDDELLNLSCTYVQDPDCFCQNNPNNPLCNLDCSFAGATPPASAKKTPTTRSVEIFRYRPRLLLCSQPQ